MKKNTEDRMFVKYEETRAKEEILASLQYHLQESHRLTELLQEKIKQAIDGKESNS